MPGPANLYGVANPVILPITASAAGPVSCSAGVETTLMSTPALVAPSAGYFYPLIWFTFTLNLGATPATGLTIAFKIGGGSDVDTFFTAGFGSYASNYTWLATTLLGQPSNTAWQAPGSIINITGNSGGQLSAIYNMKYVVALFRAPDQ